MSQLCNGDADRPLKFEIMDHDDNNDDDSMGVFNTSVNSLLSHTGTGLNVIEESKRSDGGYVNSGTIIPTPHIEVQQKRLFHHPACYLTPPSCPSPVRVNRNTLASWIL